MAFAIALHVANVGSQVAYCIYSAKKNITAAALALQMYLLPSFGGDKAAGETGRAIGSILSLELNTEYTYRDQMLRQSDCWYTKLVAAGN